MQSGGVVSDVSEEASNDTAVAASAPRRARGDLETAQQHALATAHLPGQVVNHELQPYALSQLSEQDIVEMHGHRAFSHMTRQDMLNLVQRYGPNNAAHLGDTILAQRTAMAKRGVDVSKVPLLLPVTRAEDLNPLTTVLSTEGYLPFQCSILPVMYETLQEILTTEGAHMEHILLALPYLPMPVVCTALPHVLFQRPFPPAMNSFVWMRHLLAVIRMCEQDATMLDEATQQRLRSEHEQRWRDVDASFERATNELLTQLQATGSAEPTDQLLVALESVCCQHQLNFIRCLELSAASFYAVRNQPAKRVRVRGPKDMHVTDPGQLAYEDTPANDGVPDAYMNSLWCMMTLLPLASVRDDVRAELLKEMDGVLKARDAQEGVAMPAEWSVSRANAELEAVPRYATLTQLRHHWQHVFSDTPFAEYQWYVQRKADYERALSTGLASVAASGAAAAAATAANGTLITVTAPADDAMPPLVPGVLPGLPTGALVAGEDADDVLPELEAMQ